ncbi:MAG: cysteine synthase B, partial [Parvicellaceae bacterium]
KLALEFGIIGGMSSGGAFSAAMKVATEIDKGVVVFIVCDRGERYLSSELYD